MRYHIYMTANEMMSVDTDEPINFDELATARWMTCKDVFGHTIHINVARIEVIKEVSI